jgi:AcrR family transcriptional regulator
MFEDRHKPKRKARADSERNRDRLVVAAKAVFTDKGAEASLDEIAQLAGVGNATLYRHFPTRETLIAAVYHRELDTLVEAAEALAGDEKPDAALRRWLMLYLDYMAAKGGMSAALQSVVASTTEIFQDTTARLEEAVTLLTNRIKGASDTPMDPLDLLRALGGIALFQPSPDWRRSAVSFIDILIAGLKAGRAR